MGLLGIKEKGTRHMRFVVSERYSKDNTEKELHNLIAENPKLIMLEKGEGVSPPIVTIGNHLRLPTGEEIDLLLMDIKGNLTVVELKRDRTPRDVIAQILDYVSILYQMSINDLESIIKERADYPGGFSQVLEKLKEGQPEYQDISYQDVEDRIKECLTKGELNLLIVSYEIDESIRRVVDYLREVYEMKIYCVEFDYFSDEGCEYFIPEIIGGEEVERIEQRRLTQTEKDYLNFYGELLNEFKVRKPNVTQQKALPQSWLMMPIGHSGIHLEWAFHGRPRDNFEVGLHFEMGTLEENRKIFEFFKKIEEDLKKELGENIKFQLPWGKRWARIYTIRDEGEMTKELKEWAVNTMVKWHEIIKPRLDNYFRTKIS